MLSESQMTGFAMKLAMEICQRYGPRDDPEKYRVMFGLIFEISKRAITDYEANANRRLRRLYLSKN